MRQYIRELEIDDVRQHYSNRVETHRTLRQLFEQAEVDKFVDLALGISDPSGNYSARVHEVPMGPRILSECQASDVFELARKLDAVEKNHVPLTIRNERIRYLKISIGSEMAMMLRPNELWVGNKRTYWASLLVESGDLQRANEQLELYYDRDDDGEMDYLIWSDLYLRIENQLLDLGREAAKIAREAGVKPGRHQFLWPDAVAGYLFDRFASRPGRRKRKRPAGKL
jgi:hypothetical protein